MRNSGWKWQLAYVVAWPWVGPVLTYIAADRNRWGFLFWPLIYLAVGMYLEQPGRYHRAGGTYGKLAYNMKVLALFFLCLFEVVANCLAPLRQRFLIAALLYVPYLVAAVAGAYAARRMRPRSPGIEQPPATDRDPGLPPQ